MRSPKSKRNKTNGAKKVHWFLDIFFEKNHGNKIGHYFKRPVDAIF